MTAEPERTRPRRGWAVAAIAAGLALVAGAEAVARLVVGLGSPPLLVAHPRIEYYFAPNQDLTRFHNRISYNQFGMRSDPFVAGATDRVVLVLGDSVVNGGSLTDQHDLATTRLQSRLSETEATFVGNVSAGSWGPGNLLGYIETFGTFDADAVVLVLSSHDAADVPGSGPLDPMTHPTRAPRLALEEVAIRYLPRVLALVGGAEATSVPPSEEAVAEALAALDGLFARLAARGIPTCVVQHATRRELETGLEDGASRIAAAADEAGVPRLALADHLPRTGDRLQEAYRDDIHLSAAGQAYLADALAACLAIAVVPRSP